MSLTSHLARKGAVSTWMREQFPIAQRLPLVQACRPLLREAITLLPVQDKSEGKYPHNVIGTAIDYRLRLHFAPFPPRLVAHQGAQLLIKRNALFEKQGRDEPGVPEAVITEFFASLDALVAHLLATGRALADKEEESLARYCVALAHLEAVYRAGTSIESPLVSDQAPQSVAALLELCAPAMARDLSALSRRFAHACPDLVELGADVVQNPTFAGSRLIGGADADFIADGCLWDIKTTIKPYFDGGWLYQLLGYTLLDFEDARAIRAVGVYMARQGVRFCWPLAELLDAMSAGGAENLLFEAHLQTLRGDFQALLQKEWGREQAHISEQREKQLAHYRATRDALQAELALAAEKKNAAARERRKRKK